MAAGDVSLPGTSRTRELQSGTPCSEVVARATDLTLFRTSHTAQRGAQESDTGVPPRRRGMTRSWHIPELAARASSRSALQIAAGNARGSIRRLGAAFPSSYRLGVRPCPTDVYPSRCWPFDADNPCHALHQVLQRSRGGAPLSFAAGVGRLDRVGGTSRRARRTQADEGRYDGQSDQAGRDEVGRADGAREWGG